MSKVKAEYIWIDGYNPTQNLRSKTRIVDGPVTEVAQLPNWGFDGSSTLQAEGNDSDCMLKPVCFIPDPIRKGDHILVMCEVFNADGSVHTAHTVNLVPVIVLDDNVKEINNGILADVAPTILSLMNIGKPNEMTGKSLISIN